MTVARASPFSPGLRRAVAVNTTRKGSGPLQGGGPLEGAAAAGVAAPGVAGGGVGCEQPTMAKALANVPITAPNPAYPQHIVRMFGGRSLPAKGRAAEGGVRPDLAGLWSP